MREIGTRKIVMHLLNLYTLMQTKDDFMLEDRIQKKANSSHVRKNADEKTPYIEARRLFVFIHVRRVMP